MGLKSLILRAAPGRVIYELNRFRKRCLPTATHLRQRELRGAIGNPGSVMQGPFKGMRYLTTTAATNPLDDLLGTFEIELHPAIERMIARRPDVVIDVGTATGYYAVGMALRVPGARVIGYDISPYARAVTRRLAALNGVAGRVQVRRACSPDELARVLAGAKAPVIISDCEGYEDVLLDPSRVPELRRAVVVVELHDMFVPGVSDRLRERFEPTHTVQKHAPRDRGTADLPPGVSLSPEQAALCMSVGRGDGSAWFEMTPRDSA